MFLTGPEVIKAVTGEDVTAPASGARRAQLPQRRRASHGAQRSRLSGPKLLLSYLPQNNNEDPPQIAPYDPADRKDESLNS